MKIIILALLIITTAGLSACSGEKAAAQKAVASNLKDPESAKFGEFTRLGKDFVCLGVNAKNSMGGYTGEQQAILVEKSGEWHVVTIQKISHQDCIEFSKKNSKFKLLIEDYRKTL